MASKINGELNEFLMKLVLLMVALQSLAIFWLILKVQEISGG